MTRQGEQVCCKIETLLTVQSIPYQWLKKPFCLLGTSFGECRALSKKLFEKYASASATVRSLQQAGATVLHGIDATKLDEYEWDGEKFDRIVFNFPHVGGATKEDLLRNQALLREFFSSSKEIDSLTKEIEYMKKFLNALQNCTNKKKYASRMLQIKSFATLM